MLEHIESKLDAGIDRSLDTIVGWIKVILTTQCSQKDLFRAESFNDMEKRDNLISSVDCSIISIGLKIC